MDTQTQQPGRDDERMLRRQRLSLIVSLLLALVALAVTVVLLLSAASEFLPDAPGLDYSVIQGGLLLLAVAFGIYALDRERTLRRLNERLLSERVAAERLRAMDEMKDTVLRTVSHDLRAPVTSILTAAGLLRDYSDRLSEDVAGEVIGRITAQGERLDRMLSDILDLDRLTSGRIEVRRRPVDMGEVVRGAVQRMDVADRRVELETESFILGVDPTQIERIVENLVGNALKHTPEGASVTVRVVQHQPEPNIVGALLVVEDSGPGIPPEMKTAIFQAFERGESGGRSGAGVGLHLVSRFAELHGGTAWVEDRPGGGASFRVFVPDRRRPRAED